MEEKEDGVVILCSLQFLDIKLMWNRSNKKLYGILHITTPNFLTSIEEEM